MKKTLITLLALAGVASASVVGDWQGAFTWGANTSDNPETPDVDETAVTPITLNLGTGAPITINSVTAVMTAAASGADASIKKDDTPNPLPEAVTAVYKQTNNNAYQGTFTPDTNVGNGGTWTITLNFTNTSDELIDVRVITFDYFLFNGSGGLQDGSTYRDLVFSLSGDVSASCEVSAVNTGGKSQTLTFDLGDDYLTLEAGESANVSLYVEEGVSNGTFVGLSGASFRIIPEPATATLSLLALCGLAVRRRRAVS